MVNKRLLLALLFVPSVSFFAKAADSVAPSASDVLKSVLQHHPKLLELEAKSGQRQATLDAAEAAFDISVEQETALRTSGYYSGDYLTQRVVNPLGFANAKLKGEYRYANGDFPYYEREYPTLSGGEASVGLSLSLLQNRDIDKKRMAIQDAQLGIGQWQAEQAQAINILVFSGLSTYLDWYESHLNEKVYEDLLATTQMRGKAIAKRVSTGDLAPINQTEFNVTLMQRELALQQAKQKAVQSREKLAYYFRNAQFKPVSADTLTGIPNDIAWPWRADKLNQGVLSNYVNTHPELAELRSEITLAENKLKLAQNSLLPTLDLEAKLARDLGNGPENLTGTESKVSLQFSMPLGRRQAKAEEAQAQLKLQALNYQLQTTSEAILRDVKVAFQAVEYAQRIAALQEQQAQLAEQLFTQEKKRFEMGDSDLFLLNSREAQAIGAKLDTISAKIAIKRATLITLYQAGMLANDETTLASR